MDSQYKTLFMMINIAIIILSVSLIIFQITTIRSNEKVKSQLNEQRYQTYDNRNYWSYHCYYGKVNKIEKGDTTQKREEMKINMEDILYTVSETAKLLKTNSNYVYDLIKKGLLPALKLGSFKIRRTSLIEFLAKYEGQDLTNLDNITNLEVVKDE